MSNSRFQRYAITRLICEKPGYRLYEGRDTKEERRVSMKILHHDLAADDNLVRRFLDAATLSSYIDSPNILKVADCSKTADGYAIISEPIDGNPLSFFMQDGFPLEFERAMRVTKEIANVLRHAHLKGVIHGILNPACIFLTEAEELKIDDFGLSWLARYARGDLNRETQPYLSPEIRAGKVTDGRSDIYSLGVILFTLLSGELELLTATAGPDSLVKTLPRLGQIDAGASKRLQDILWQCLHPNVNHRFGNMHELSRALDGLQVHLPASSPQ